MRPRDLFYGWRIVGIGVVIQILIGGLMMQAFGAYAAVLRDEFGWSKALFSFAFSVTRVESGILGPLQGWLIDTLGPRKMMRAGLVMLGIGFLLFSQIDTQWHFFVSYLLMAIGASVGGFMTLTVAIVNWFERRRATAMAIPWRFASDSVSPHQAISGSVKTTAGMALGSNATLCPAMASTATVPSWLALWASMGSPATSPMAYIVGSAVRR